VSLPATRILKRFLGPAFMGLAMKFVGWLQGQGVPVVVTLHERCDREHARRLVPSGIDIFYTESVDELIARFEESIGVVGFRLHAGLLGMGLGKPIIAAGVDWRGLAAIETFGFQDLAVRPFRLGQLAKLKRLAGRLLARDAGFSARQQQAKEHFRGRHEEFFRQAVRRFSGRARAG
jgi:polysaccharide pyruvyl transferase WcaK-like protein